MRTMRDIPWYYYLLAVPVVAIVFGIAFVAKNRAHVKQSELGLKAEIEEAQKRLHERNPLVPGVKKLPHALVKLNELLSGNAQDQCSKLEYAGLGPKVSSVSKAEWSSIMDKFHASKTLLLGWLNEHRKTIPEKTAAVMENQIKEIRIQRPPTTEEPDLTWRGILAWTYDSKGEAMIRVGSGFVKLAVKHPAWAKFELARYLAMSWAPCELRRAGVDSPWASLTKCLGIEETDSCLDGSYSEAGWAVSTALAERLSKSGCVIPGLSTDAAKACLSKEVH
jgi:hypothetical protein